MTSPIWINCESLSDLPQLCDLEKKATEDTHVVLKFSDDISEKKRRSLIKYLREKLPSKSVFDSSSTLDARMVTIMQVTAEKEILENSDQILFCC
jgi:hypothetical protein